MIDRRRWLGVAGLAIGGGLAALDPLARSAVPGSAAHGGVRARLSLNENPYGPAPGVRQALLRELPELCRYTAEEGYDALVQSIAARERVSADRIILGEILEPLGTHLSLSGGAGGEFVYSDPGYTALVDAAIAAGGRAVPVPLDASLRNDYEALAARIGEHTRAIYLVNPHNPTGIVSDAEELRRFVRSASRRALIVVDEAYLEYTDRLEQLTLTDLVRGGENVIVFRTFAKAHGLAGLDLGYGLVPQPLAAMLRSQGFTNPHLFNRLAIAAATASLADPVFIAHVSRIVAGERERWFHLLRSLGRRFTPSVANFVFFETGMPHAQFAERLRREGIEIGRDFKPYDHWARISIGLPEENALARSAVEALWRTS